MESCALPKLQAGYSAKQQSKKRRWSLVTTRILAFRITNRAIITHEEKRPDKLDILHR